MSKFDNCIVKNSLFSILFFQVNAVFILYFHKIKRTFSNKCNALHLTNIKLFLKFTFFYYFSCVSIWNIGIYVSDPKVWLSSVLKQKEAYFILNYDLNKGNHVMKINFRNSFLQIWKRVCLSVMLSRLKYLTDCDEICYEASLRSWEGHSIIFI